MLKGFKDFILRGNVVDLAVGVVIGVAFGTIVNALVKDTLTPLVGAIAKLPDFSNLALTINGSKFLIGDFINSLISFLLVTSAVYFFVVLPVNKLMAKFHKAPPEEPPKTKICPECFSEIPLAAKRCMACTQPV